METAGVVWVGDLSSRITEGALLDAFSQVRLSNSPPVLRWLTCTPAHRLTGTACPSQFGAVAQSGLLHDAFTGAHTHCGWVRFTDPGVVPTLLTTCNHDHLLCIGAPALGTRGGQHRSCVRGG